MNKYNQNSKCPKCGCTVIGIKFTTTELIYDDSGRLERTCARCGYFWFEKPLDKEN